jgi:hypothetical protein
MASAATLPATAVWVAAQEPVGQAWPVDTLVAGWTASKAIAALPFDTLRANHASAVRAGLVQNSMLASRDFEHVVVALEQMTLGPLARRA